MTNTPPFIILVKETNEPHNNKWPDVSPELAFDLKEIYHVDADLLMQALNFHSPTIRHFDVQIDKERQNDIS